MQEERGALWHAGQLLMRGDADLVEIVLLSLQVTGTATLLAGAVGLVLGGLVAVTPFRGRGLVVAGLNALMGLPPVVVGLLVYLALSRSGPLGPLGLIFTPTAMVIAQTLLVAPIVTAIARQTLSDLDEEYGELIASLELSRTQAVMTLLWEGRYSLLPALLAGFGRAVGEVGAVILVGGNIAHVTRVMTTAIALETSRGELDLALALGAILVTLAFLVNALALTLQQSARRIEA